MLGLKLDTLTRLLEKWCCLGQVEGRLMIVDSFLDVWFKVGTVFLLSLVSILIDHRFLTLGKLGIMKLMQWLCCFVYCCSDCIVSLEILQSTCSSAHMTMSDFCSRIKCLLSVGSCLFSLVNFFYSDTGIGRTFWNGLDCKAHESILFTQLWFKVVCTTLI